MECGLKPAVEYTFSARCSDSCTWSLWTAHPLKVRTALTDTVDLVLKPLSEPRQPPSGGQRGPVGADRWCHGQ
jgi:hypothetical protein